MGKKGDLLRAEKAGKTVYTFTRQQLEEHDRFLLDQKRDELKRKLTEEMEAKYTEREKEALKNIHKEWDEREAMFKSGSAEDGFMMMLSLLLAVSARILVEQFGWKPIPKGGYSDRRKLGRFSAAIVDTINDICSDENKDIRRFCDETYEKYGVRFVMKEDEE